MIIRHENEKIVLKLFLIVFKFFLKTNKKPLNRTKPEIEPNHF